MKRNYVFLLAIGAIPLSGCASIQDSGGGKLAVAINVPTTHAEPRTVRTAAVPLNKIAHPEGSSKAWTLGEREDLNLGPELYDGGSSSMHSDRLGNMPITVKLAMVKRIGKKSRWFFEVDNATPRTWMGQIRVWLMNDNTEIYEQDLKLEFAAYGGLQAACDPFDIAAFPASMGGNINGYKWAVSRAGFQSVTSSQAVTPETRKEQRKVTEEQPEEQIYWQQTGKGRGTTDTPTTSPDNLNEPANTSPLGGG